METNEQDFADEPERRFCLDQLAALDRAHRAAAKPYLDRLVAIESMRVRPQTLLHAAIANLFVKLPPP